MLIRHVVFFMRIDVTDDLIAVALSELRSFPLNQSEENYVNKIVSIL